MKILHYTLGLPPYRTGGLTKYSLDLMINQLNSKHKVFLLFPGHHNFLKVSIKYLQKYQGLEVYELVNPLPVPLLGGIGRPEMFSKSTSKETFIKFLQNIKPEIIHVHTLMGLYFEFLEAARELKIKIVFTTHDYFGICPRVNLIDYKHKVCNDFEEGNKCVNCNMNSYNLSLIYVLQSRLYRTFKNNYLLDKMKVKFNKVIKKKSDLKFTEKQNDKNNKTSNIKHNQQTEKLANGGNQYFTLRGYYLKLLSQIDYFHFNSSVSEKIYRSFVNAKGKVINITHSEIMDKRKRKVFSDTGENLKITFLGPLDIYKGYYLLRESLETLSNRGITNWQLNVYGNSSDDINEVSKFVVFNGRYTYGQLEEIFDNTDLLVVPSLCKETFGFTGLEGFSFGVPILVSENVGNKDIITNGKTGIIFNSEKEQLANSLEMVIKNRQILADINYNILNTEFNYTMEEHTRNIIKLYYQVLEG